MKTLMILNDPPYGTERSYNALRLARSLSQRSDAELRIFLMGDAAVCGKKAQVTPKGYYNLERMLEAVARREVPIGACGTCMDARGMDESELTPGVHRSSLDELTEWTVWADKVIVF
jgi:uncharacterized protein involved in oxidation of intracellular sulfur